MGAIDGAGGLSADSLFEALALETDFDLYNFDIAGAWDSTTAGTGAVREHFQHLLDIVSGATNGGSCVVAHSRFVGWMRNTDRIMIDWSIPFWLTLLMTPADSSANGEMRIKFGEDNTRTIQALQDMGVGLDFQVNDDPLTVTGLVHSRPAARTRWGMRMIACSRWRLPTTRMTHGT